MFLKEIENRPPEGMMRVAFDKIQGTGHAVPEIMHLFRFKPAKTAHLVRFTEEVLRGPSPLSRGLRELIGAFVSTRNNCNFCASAHVAVAEQLLGKPVVQEVLLDFENSRLDPKHKALFRYLYKIAENPADITASDVARLKDAGWSEEEIYEALTVASLFKFYNTWNNGSGVQTMRPVDFDHSGERIVKLGYCMDFGFVTTLKVMWRGRKEVAFSDLLSLAKGFLTGRSKQKQPSTPAAKIANSEV